jgi:hypothetical protein
MKVNPRNILFSSTFGKCASASRTRLAILSLYAIGLPAGLSAAVYPETLECLLQLRAGGAHRCHLLAVRTIKSGRATSRQPAHECKLPAMMYTVMQDRAP